MAGATVNTSLGVLQSSLRFEVPIESKRLVDETLEVLKGVGSGSNLCVASNRAHAALAVQKEVRKEQLRSFLHLSSDNYIVVGGYYLCEPVPAPRRDNKPFWICRILSYNEEHCSVQWLEQANYLNPYTDPWVFHGCSATTMDPGILAARVEMGGTWNRTTEYTVDQKYRKLCTYWAQKWATINTDVVPQTDESALR
jgi:hypothetical protein